MFGEVGEKEEEEAVVYRLMIGYRYLISRFLSICPVKKANLEIELEAPVVEQNLTSDLFHLIFYLWWAPVDIEIFQEDTSRHDRPDRWE